MKASLIAKKGDNTSIFMVEDVDVSLLNGLRRSIVAHVPTLAIENVEVRQNSGILYDEMLAHRLGLIPLKTDLVSYEKIEKPEDEMSLKHTVKFTLNVKGPKTVYAKDLTSTDPGITPVYGEMPIGILKKGQEIQLEAVAMLGIGREHMKWSPGVVVYKQKPSITVGKTVDVDALAEMLPEGSAVTIEGGKVKVNDELLYTTPYFDAYLNEEVVPGLAVKGAERDYVFTVESFGQLSVKEMITEGAETLKQKLSDLSNTIKTL